MLQGCKMTCLMLKAFQVVRVILCYQAGRSNQEAQKIRSNGCIGACEKDGPPMAFQVEVFWQAGPKQQL